jgi:hypothetical protein
MPDLESRIALAESWLHANLADGGQGRCGWGWVPDIPPNPQNTAEVVCALVALGRPVPEPAGVEKLVRSSVVANSQRGDWAFDAVIDVAWRLRALRCLGAGPEDPDLRSCVCALVEAQEPASGGWRIAGRLGSISATATTAAVEALLDLEMPGIDLVAVRRKAVSTLIDAVLDDDELASPLHACAQIAHLLAAESIVELGGTRIEKARNRALRRVLDSLGRGYFAIEEEVFRRGTVTDTWRHTTLPMSLRAVAVAAPDRIIEPPFRAGLVTLLNLQETAPTNVNRGGFRTSQEGFVTSYATTQSLEVLGQVRIALGERTNPARTFDFLCRTEGAHHSDPQDLVTVRGRTVTMNSWAGSVLLVIGLLTGATIIAMSIGFQHDLGVVASRALVVWGMTPPAFCTFACTCVRLPRTSNAKIAAVVFSGFTALLLPIVTFLLA